MTYRQPTSWISQWLARWSRPLIGAIAILGIFDTAFITAEKLNAAQASFCSAGCSVVLNSPYAEVLGYPLALFGMVAYVGMALLALVPLAIDRSRQSEETPQEISESTAAQTELLVFLGALAMTVFSGYLMYLLAFELHALCYFCLASAIFSLTMLVLAIAGRTWEDLGQAIFSSVMVLMVTLVGTLGLFSDAAQGTIAGTAGTQIRDQSGNVFFIVDTESTDAEQQLAQHLKASGATMYGAYWCPHCCEQKQLFGQTAMKDINYVECAPSGKNSDPEQCKAVVQAVEAQTGEKFGFPTWKIGDRYYSGRKTLSELAELSGYTGPQSFQNPLQICKMP